MPIVIPRDLPAFDSLLHEKIFVMDGSRAVSQDIRPIEIAILNLMPTKEVTETQLLRLLGNTPSKRRRTRQAILAKLISTSFTKTLTKLKK